MRGRLPSSRVSGVVEVDARFVLADERTLLAWVRTALTFVAGGVAVHQLADERGSAALATGLLLVGLGAAVAGAVRFAAADRAVRSGRVPATGRSPYVLVAVVCVVALVAVGVVLA